MAGKYFPSANKLKTEWQQVLFIGTLCSSGGAISEFLGSSNEKPASVNLLFEGAMQGATEMSVKGTYNPS